MEEHSLMCPWGGWSTIDCTCPRPCKEAHPYDGKPQIPHRRSGGAGSPGKPSASSPVVRPGEGKVLRLGSPPETGWFWEVV